MADYLLVGIGGFIGASSRFFLGKVLSDYSGVFPVGILIVNVIAAVFIGFFAELSKELVNPRLALFLMTGILGGFSTFSTFSLDTMKLIMDRKLMLATGNVVLNVGLCLMAVIIGMKFGKVFKF